MNNDKISAEVQNKELNDKYEIARAKSVGENKKVTVDLERYRYKIKKSFLMGAMSAALVTSAVIPAGAKVYDYVDELKTIEKYTDYGHDLVKNNTKVTENGQGYYYEVVDIAESLKDDPQNLHVNLYGVYSSLSYNRDEIMDNIIRLVSGSNPEDECFKNYLKNFGCVKSDGTLDKSKYEKIMKKYIKALNEKEKSMDFVDEVKIRGGK